VATAAAKVAALAQRLVASDACASRVS